MLRESLKYMFFTLGAVLALGLLIHTLIAGLPATPAQSVQAEITPEVTTMPETPTPIPTPTPEPEAHRKERLIQAAMDSLTVEEKLGQLLMFGFEGKNSPDEASLAVFDAYQVGNSFLYGGNVESSDPDGGFARAGQLTAQLNARTVQGIPPLVSVDVEGGSVVRFFWDPWPESPRSLGREGGDPEKAKEQFYQIGKTLLETGFHINFAPVMDVAPSPMDTFLTTRIISSDPAVASQVGTAIIEGLQEAGCLATAKHFPGHGGTAGDSHQLTPRVDKSLDAMRAYDLVPFQAAIDAGVDAIMVAHILYPQLDPENIATLSQPIITGLLREEMGFDGLVISDDFRMKGITTQASPEESAVQFILAGGDIILCGPMPERQAAIGKALKAAYENGTLTEARLNESVYRILSAKYSFGNWAEAFDQGTGPA